ncbi:glycerophosphodiester phosphodiesterase domain-containing protein 4 isoform X3 [Prionailurus bengalensis]|uniref:glycerophosphodiester phosphodiesterase domain-containing protein 4 isoform X3 n=1 Tax=Prionailurus bengalensis TaxID=37029 RepID=UPI001CAA3690|nr:glycerophosphodiester phosphodiesterase domain-containing protein 4 isoform X3 [Prionailurus bengalensis]
MLKKANRIEPGSQQERSLKKHNPWIICTCSRQCYITLITGCYTCEWQIKQEKKSRPGPCCCSWKEKIFFPFLIISFLLSVVLLFVWIETSNEYFGFDWVIFLGTGYWFFWSIVLLSLFGILTAYSSLLVVLAFLLVWEGYELYLHWCHKILILLMILLCSFVLWILCQLWQERWLTAGLSLQIFAPYMHLSGITVMVILSWPVAFYLIHLEEEVRMRRYKMMYDRETAKGCNILTKLRALQVAIGLPFFLILLCLYIVPLGIHSPCIQEEDKLGPKPDFFGHRGAPMLGPENTMMSFEKAIEQGAYGLESDVQLSYDQVPFLMHDNDLRRTTNIRNVQPNASITHSSFFLWSFLSSLNAGKWFVQSQIFWLPSFDRQYVQSRAPGFQQVGQLFSIERLTKENISRINVDYKRLFYKGLKDYKAANININLYIVNEPWLYSLAWCSRIHSVTTDNIQTLSQLNHPYFFMTPGYYMFMWLLMDSVSAVLIFAIFYFHWWRESKKEMFNNSIHTDLRSLSLQQREHGSQDSTNLPIKPSFRVLGNPWALSAFYPALTKSTKKQPGSCHFLVVPKKKSSEPEQVKETVKPLRPSKDDVRQPSPTKKTFEPTWDAPREATLETALPSLKVNKPTISSLEIAQSETESEKTSTFESSQQYSFSVFSTISSMFSYELTSKKN